MTQRHERTALSSLAGLCGGLGLLLLVGTAGCTSTNVEDVAPQPGTVTGPKDTGTYPNLNIPPQQAAEQFTDADKDAKLARLQAEQAAANAAAAQAARTPNAAELDKLARTHASDTLKQIEGKCDAALDPTCK